MIDFNIMNDGQKKAVTELDGVVCCTASAGSGKTFALINRVSYMVESGVKPEDIMVCTFTKKAGLELTSKLKNVLSIEDVSNATVGTMHSIFYKILRTEMPFVNKDFAKIKILIDWKQKKFVKDAFKKVVGKETKFCNAKIAMTNISRAKNELMTPDALDRYLSDNDNDSKLWVADVYREYERAKKFDNSIDFDDMLQMTFQLFKQNTSILTKYQSRWKYVLIDEFQDTNTAQFKIIQMLVEKHGNLFVVGDVKQCLVEDTSITMGDGSIKKIQDVKVGDMVLSGKGSHIFNGAEITDVYKKEVSSTIACFQTESGKIVKSTLEHSHIAGYTEEMAPNGLYFLYLMYKDGIGYRVGTTRVLEEATTSKSRIGVKFRTSQEHANKSWIIATYDNEVDARKNEMIVSLKYQIPTLMFKSRTYKNGKYENSITSDQEAIDDVFGSTDNEDAIDRLFRDYLLFKDSPHVIPKTSNSKRNKFGIILCADGRANDSRHLYSFYTSDMEVVGKLKGIGLNIRQESKSKPNNWKIDSSSQDFAKIEGIYKKISTVVDDLEILQTVRLNTKGLPVIPASHIRKGMSVFNEAGEYELVTEMWFEQYDGCVYDLNVKTRHNFSANGIMTHNSIYGFRGAKVEYMSNIENYFPEVKRVHLELTYRCAKNVISVANKLATLMNGHNATAVKNGGSVTYLGHFMDEDEESEAVADVIEERLKFGVNSKDIKILYRTNSQSRAFEESLRKRGIPYVIVGGNSFFNRKEIKDMIAYLKIIDNPETAEESYLRVFNKPTRMLGRVFAGQWSNNNMGGTDCLDALICSYSHGYMERNAKKMYSELKTILRGKSSYENVGELLEEIRTSVGYDDWLNKDISTLSESEGGGVERATEIVDEFTDFARKFKDLGVMLEYLGVLAGGSGKKEDSVQIMTVHKSKGLEADIVFVGGVSQGLMPHFRGDLKEERRLAYVAFTRAKTSLYLSGFTERNNDELAESQFLSEVGIINEYVDEEN